MAWSALLLLATWVASSALSQEDNAPEKKVEPPAFKRGVVIEFKGEITPWLEGYFERKLARAKSAGCDLVVVNMESPGGYLHTSQEIAGELRDAHGMHTVTYIQSYAYSGGAYISLGSDEILMAPSAAIGDVGVINWSQDAFRYIPEKELSPIVSGIRDLAEAKGRPPALAEAMMDKNCEVYRVRNKTNGRIWYMTEKELAAQEDNDDWEKLELVLESQKGKFLTLSGKRAVTLQIASATAADLDEVRKRFDTELEWLHYRPDSVDRTVYVLTMWWVTGLLFLVGIIGLIYELSAPGTCVGGLIALTCFALFFWSRFLVGTSGVLELVLFLLALVFLGVEVFVLPGFGVSGVMGLLLLGASLVLACQNFIVPETSTDWSQLGASLGLVVGVGVVVLITGIATVQIFGTVPFFNKLVLAPPIDPPAKDLDKEPTDKVGLVRIGEIGRAEYALRPSGRARFGDRFLDVVADGQFIAKGTAVEVIAVDDQVITVREVVG